MPIHASTAAMRDIPPFCRMKVFLSAQVAGLPTDSLNHSLMTRELRMEAPRVANMMSAWISQQTPIMMAIGKKKLTREYFHMEILVCGMDKTRPDL